MFDQPSVAYNAKKGLCNPFMKYLGNESIVPFNNYIPQENNLEAFRVLYPTSNAVL